MSELNWGQTVKALLYKHSKTVSLRYRAQVLLHTRSRKAALAYLATIDSYRNHNERCPLSWKAKVYADLTVDELYNSDCRLEHFSGGKKAWEALNDGQRGAIYLAFRQQYTEDIGHLWQLATQDVWEGFRDDLSTFWGEDVPREWGLRGRMGGNLVLLSVDGAKLEGSYRSGFLETYQERDPDDNNRYVAPHEELAKIVLVCIQHEIDWPQNAIDDAVTDAAAWIVWSRTNADAAVEQYNRNYPRI